MLSPDQYSLTVLSRSLKHYSFYFISYFLVKCHVKAVKSQSSLKLNRHDIYLLQKARVEHQTNLIVFPPVNFLSLEYLIKGFVNEQMSLFLR